MNSLILRAALAVALVVAMFFAALVIVGPSGFTRLLGTVNAADPTTGRAHFWNVTLHVIKDYPILGSGFGSFSVIYPRYDSRNGTYRLEQAHNDYLQTLAHCGIVAGALGLSLLSAWVASERHSPPLSTLWNLIPSMQKPIMALDWSSLP